MKAAVCREFGAPLAIEDVEIRTPGPGEVMIKIAACAICRSDIHYADGAWGGKLPAVYGHEAAGTVEAIGAGVKGLGPGDPVIVTLLRACGSCDYCRRHEPYLCDTRFPLDETSPLHDRDGRPIEQGLRTGAFAEYVLVDQSQVVPLTEDVPLESAALLACGVITGVGAVTRTASVRAGDGVVVIGTGGVGLNSIQGAVLAGAHPIIALDTAGDRRLAALALGASHAIDPTDGDAVAKVLAMTGGRGADAVLVIVGSAGACTLGLTLLRRGGALVIVGMPPSGVSVPFEPGELAGAGQRILGSKMGSTNARDDIPRLAALYREGRLKLDELISGRYPLERINDAIADARVGVGLRTVVVM
jgi:S-(hydroxymethyl)glutathione dehydrogenase/alcohol dehydrogenase